MNIRGWMDENQNLVAVIAVVVIILALIFSFYNCSGSSTGPGGSGMVYYYDITADEIFTAKAELIPPIQSPNDNEAVRVHFYTCGSCKESERFVGYYEKYTPEVKKKLEEAQGNEEHEMYYEQESQGLLISLDAKKWYPMYAQQAEQALSNKLKCDEGKKLRYCHAK